MMSIKTYTPEVRLSGRVAVERECSYCKKIWKEEIEINATGRGESRLFSPDPKEAIRAKEKAYKELKQKEEEAKKQAHTGVLCPYCNHFSTDAMAKHFPDGFLAGIKKKINKTLLTSLLIFPPCGFLMAILINEALFSTAAGSKNENTGRIIAGILALPFGCFFIYNLITGFRLLFGYGRVNKYLQTKNDKELLEIAVSLYKANENSLHGNYAWTNMLLKRSKSR